MSPRATAFNADGQEAALGAWRRLYVFRGGDRRRRVVEARFAATSFTNPDSLANSSGLGGCGRCASRRIKSTSTGRFPDLPPHVAGVFDDVLACSPALAPRSFSARTSGRCPREAPAVQEVAAVADNRRSGHA
jgi:hypothetical protein